MPPTLCRGAGGTVTIEQALIHLGAQRRARPRAAEDAGVAAEEVRGEAGVELPTWQRHPESPRPPPAGGTGTGVPPPQPPGPCARHPEVPGDGNPPMTVLANAPSGSCGHLPRPLSTLVGSKLKACWGWGQRGCDGDTPGGPTWGSHR